MKIYGFLFFLFFLSFASVYAQNAVIAPIVCYDENTQKLDFPENPNEKLYSLLEKYWLEGLVGFKKASEKDYDMVNSAVDAQRVCNILGEQYIIYGFVQKNEASWYGNLKLYDSEKRKIVDEFFVVDKISRYDRFMETLADRILEGFEQVLGLSQRQLAETKKRPFEFRIPISGFYWSPITEKWNDAYMGIAGGNLGLEIFPPLKNNTIKSLRYDFSGQIRATYSYGKESENEYPLNLHKISVGLPLLAHIYLSKYHGFYIGGGMAYSYEILTVTEKYEEERTLKETFFNALGILGYELSVCEWFKIFTDVEFDFHLSDDKFIEVRPTLGFSFSIYRGERYDD
ncbi:hypothetical protein [Treponema sp.]|uniref:hypothetical protein n=1 Tax=Treponema sp. TaxID=166 RepID=UPI00388FED3E